jgi:DNA-binding transcriptional LysR family regulator
VTSNESEYARELLERAVHDVTFVPGGRLHSNGVDALMQAAVGGFGIGYVREGHVEDLVATGQLAKLPKVRAVLDFIERELRGTRKRARDPI